MKCLPYNKIHLAKGNILHDWHAEVLAIRAFNRFLLDQCLLTCNPPDFSSKYIRRRAVEEYSDHEQQPFSIKDDVSIHMYCSEAPCGDASMELVMDAQEDATPWTSTPPTVLAISSTGIRTSESAETSALRGRSNFSLVGIVRCKPSRSDAPPTLSKSCTDKLALSQATSLLSSTVSVLISPRNAYLQTLVMPESQLVPQACERAFSKSGRMRGLTDSAIDAWRGGYRFQPFKTRPVKREFAWTRRNTEPFEKVRASNLSAVWTPTWQETLIGGVLQGRKQLDPRGASAICRKNMWRMAVQIAAIVGAPEMIGIFGKATYKEMKESQVLKWRRKVKEDMLENGLNGWVKNTGDDEFSLEDTPEI